MFWLAIASAGLSFSGCVVKPPTSERLMVAPSSYASPRWSQPALLVGEVPLGQALDRLRQAEVVNGHPDSRELSTLIVPRGSTLRDLSRLVERDQAWILVGREYVRYGRWIGGDDLRRIAQRRTSYPVSIRFVAVQGGLNLASVDAGLVIRQYSGVAVDGEPSSVSQTTERSYFDEVTSAETGNTVRTSRKSVSSGVNFSYEVLLMPGGLARIVGTLDVSSFVGSSADRAATNVPIQIDIDRGEWIPVHLFTGGDASVALAFKGDFDARIGGSYVRVDVRVD